MRFTAFFSGCLLPALLLACGAPSPRTSGATVSRQHPRRIGADARSGREAVCGPLPAAAFELKKLFSLAGLPSDVRFADLDGDGATDLALCEPDGTVRFRKSLALAGGAEIERKESEPPLKLGGGSPPVWLELRDVNHDGRADLLELRASGELALWLRNPAGSGFIAPGTPGGVELSPGHGAKDAIALGDFDGDGAIDTAAIDWTTGSVRFWRLWQPPGGAWQLDRAEGQKWDLTLGPRARKLAGPPQVGHFVDLGGASWGDQLLLPELGAERGLWLAGLDFAGAARSASHAPGAVAKAVIEPWARGRFAPDELASADLDHDGFSDLIEPLPSGELRVLPGGELRGVATSDAGLPSDERRCIGSPRRKLALLNLDDVNALDLVRAPSGRGLLDLWRGELACNQQDLRLPSFGPVSTLGSLERAPQKLAAFQAKTWADAAPAPGRDELAIVTDGELSVYQVVSSEPRSADSDWEDKLRVGFEKFLARDRVQAPYESYPSEAPVIELSAWRYLRGRRETPRETLSDAACFRAIADGERIRRRLRAYPGSSQWLASARMTFGVPPERDSHDAAHSNWDFQARLVIDFFTLYRVLGRPELLSAAEAAADRFLRTFERRPIDATDCGGALCLSFVNEPGNGKLYADPNQNLEIALAFALLMNAPESRYYQKERYEYLADDGSARSAELREIVTHELTVAFAAQSPETGSTSYERTARDGGLLMSSSDCYVTRAAYDTRYGAYALQSALWLWSELGSEPWFQSTRAALDPRLLRAAEWLARWSVPSPYWPAASSYRCGYRCGECNTVPVIDWDAIARFPALHFLRQHGARVCPRALLSAPWTYAAEGFQSTIFNELSGVPRDFYGEGCE